MQTIQRPCDKKRWYRNPILVASIISALISCWIVPPNPHYLHYVDIRVLILLFSLMLVIQGLQDVGVFSYFERHLLKYAVTERSLVATVVMFCFFTSMLITNDVALITFIPLAILLFTQIGRSEALIPVIVLQNAAANLGSMLTPLGNPQNLYVFTYFDISTWDFIRIMSIPTIMSFVLLAVSCFFFKKTPVSLQSGARTRKVEDGKAIIWGILFIISILAVLRVVPYYVGGIIVLVAAFFLNKRLILKVDYGLLFTFVFLFILIGNLSYMPEVRGDLTHFIHENTFVVTMLVSQVISNVPCSMLLSHFTTDYVGLLYGLNISSMGTLIASMAGVISYNFYADNVEGANKGRFLGIYTLINTTYLILLVAGVYVFGLV